ncbi:MAG: hypothetical protein KDC87_18420, partial [Planctomycetes bacterium]|nr:hypothetical protein [Planctomycetota bacterium]
KAVRETVGRPEARFPDCGMQWIHTPPPVHLPAWPVRGAPDDAPFTTVTNWWGEYELIAGQSVNNEKRSSFLACLDLPQRTRAPLELAVYQESEVGSELPLLRERGWRARPAGEVSSTAAEYRAYLQRSRGEFSCAKASCMVFANAWISDRTICYLASGKPAVVQDTGPSRMLPDACGLFRFADAAGAAAHLEALCDPEVYRRACHDARKLAEHHFDAARVLPRVLDAALAPRSGRDHATHG